MVFTWFGLLFIVLIATMAAYAYKMSRRLALTLKADVVVLDKNVGQRAARGKLWMVILKAAAFGILFTWFGFIARLSHFDTTRPIKPDFAKGAVIPHNNHGHIVYLTEKDQEQLFVLERIPIGLALIAVLASYFYKKTTGKLPS